ncbi:hypothetical protein F2Q69_00005881 [Brassica cretica]|uniref:Uncharacterized protein n=1 Tax=Brassica cretica TaxID=69181 RepID=A0A8S9PE35_BRACR|nr:hypothetical protein F2Q69_00005881 [Brassica cretica]
MDEVFYARYFGEFSREQLCGQHGTKNLAVYGQVVAGLVKVAEGILVVIWITGPCITRRPAFLRSGADGVVMRSLGLFHPMMDIDLVRGASSVANLIFHRSDFCRCFLEVIAKIADLGFLASRFPILSTFAASDPSMLFGQLFLFVPEGSFFFFGHRIIELRIILGRTAPCTTRMHVCVLVCRFGMAARIHIDAFDFSFLFVFVGVLALMFSPARCRTGSEELRNRVFFRGLGLFCAEGRPWFLLLVENIFWTSSNAAVLKLTAVTFAAGVFSALSSTASSSRVCWLLRSSADMSDQVLVAES